jgi:hypothetical protein
VAKNFRFSPLPLLPAFAPGELLLLLRKFLAWFSHSPPGPDTAAFDDRPRTVMLDDRHTPRRIAIVTVLTLQRDVVQTEPLQKLDGDRVLFSYLVQFP